jgi:hypothetical protein
MVAVVLSPEYLIQAIQLNPLAGINGSGKNVENLLKGTKNQSTKNHNLLIYIYFIVDRARFELATIALKEPCFELYTV